MGRLDIKGFDDNLLQELRSFIVQYYGSLWGNLKRFIEEAVREKLEREKQKLQSGLQLRVKRKHIKLLLWVYDRDELTSYDIINYIRNNIGIDRRTIKQYYDFLVKNKFIEEVKFVSPPKRRGDYPLIIYRTNLDRIRKVLAQHGINVDRQDGEQDIIKQTEELTIRRRGIEISETEIERQDERITKREIAAYALELYRSGYSLQEIEDKVQDLGFDYDKRKLKWLIREFGLKEADLV